MSKPLKPLIIMTPLTRTLGKLKEVVEDIKESEGIQIYVVESLEECSKIIPMVGQSLILSASPKMCAQMLQGNRRPIKKLQTKTILLSPKPIPRKTLDKFMKVGLTECVTEPVNPKTLLYKVKLQLRSIVVKVEEEEELNTKVTEKVKKKVSDEEVKEVKKEKKVKIQEESKPEIVTKGKTTEELIEELNNRERKKYKEETIDNFYRGDQSGRPDQEGPIDEEVKKKKVYLQDEIEGHLKGELKNKEEEIEGNIVTKSSTKMTPVIEDEEDPVKKTNLITIEDDMDLARSLRKEIQEDADEAEKLKRAMALDIEEDNQEDKKKNNSYVDDLGGHYKGEMRKLLSVEDEPEIKEKAEVENIESYLKEKEKKSQLTIEDDDDSITQEGDSEKLEDLMLKGELTGGTENLDEEKEVSLSSDDNKEEDDEEQKKKFSLEVTEEEQEKEKKEEQEKVEKERKSQDGKADDIDMYLRGGAAKKPNLDSEEEEDLYHDAKKEAEIEEKKRKKAGFDLENDKEEGLKKEKDSDKDYAHNSKKKNGLTIEDDDPYERTKSDKNKEDEDTKNRRVGFQEEVDDGLTKGKSQFQEKTKDEHNRSNARADKIKTHYSSKESIKHGNQEWDAVWEKGEKKEEDWGDQDQEEKELIFKKEDLGEQTIDYAQLKKEFEEISVDGISNAKKTYGELSNVAEIKTYRKTVIGHEGQAEEMEFEEVDKDLVEEESFQVFEPNSLGIEIAIQVQNYYYEKEITPEKLCQFINQKVKDTFDGSTIFYSFIDMTQETPFFNGYFVNQIGLPPTRPPSSELEQLSRSEQKEVEDEFKEENKNYKKELRALEEDWEEMYDGQLEEWKEYKTPAWKDHNFQTTENQFIFPYYEGETLMGLCVFIPHNNFNPVNAESIEAVFEVARGVIISEYHTLKGEGKISSSSSQKEKKDNEKSGGLFGRLFGKAS